MNRNFLVSVLVPGFFTLISSAQVGISPGVARISLIEGDVSAQRGDTGDRSAAALNQPLVGGDRVSTGDRSKAELQLDHANVFRLGNNAQAKIATIERARIQVQIGQGLAYYTVFKDSEDEVEIDTPNAAIRPTSKEGTYRIEVNGFETQVIVRAGAVDISTPQGGSRVEMGQAATVRGTTDEAGYVLGGAPSKDVWDFWNSERDGMSEDGVRSQPGRGWRITPSSRIPRATSNTTRRTMTPERGSRGATAGVASKSIGGSDTAVLSGVPTSTSTRRMKVAPGSRAAMARSAQRYVDSANQQMDKGNYTAAMANYKRAWQVDGNSAAAKARLGRARRAMQAENEIIANRR